MEIPVVANERNGVFLSRRIDGKASSFATVLRVERNANNSKRLTVRPAVAMAILHIQWWPFSRVEKGRRGVGRGGGAARSLTQFGVILGKDLLTLSTVLVIMRFSGSHSISPEVTMTE